MTTRNCHAKRYYQLDPFGIQADRQYCAQLTCPAQHEKSDLSKFFEEAVKWHLLEQTVAEARGAFADLAPEALGALLDEVVTTTRQTRASQAG
jgi:hypothetical protein